MSSAMAPRIMSRQSSTLVETSSLMHSVTARSEGQMAGVAGRNPDLRNAGPVIDSGDCGLETPEKEGVRDSDWLPQS